MKWNWYLGLLCVVMLNTSALSQPALRIAYTQSIGGSYDTTNASQKQMVRTLLKYYSQMGYTHIIYPLNVDVNLFTKVSGKWVYNAAVYTTGNMATSLNMAKNDIEKNGMKMIPLLYDLSYVRHLIEKDPTVSEFTSDLSYKTYCLSKGITYDASNNRVACPINNPAADQFFSEQLQVIKSNWGSTPLGGAYPEYIHICHDELGTTKNCYIKAEKSLSSPKSSSRLIADEINLRASTISSKLNSSTKILLWGDCFVPSDNGEVFGLIGNTQNGFGGVVQILRDTCKLGNKIVIMPWGYELEDGLVVDGKGIVWNRYSQIKYLDMLNVSYIPCTGNAGYIDGGNEPRIEATKRCTFEWIKASQLYPKNLVGFAHVGWDHYSSVPTYGVCSDFNAPILAYFAWTFGDRSLKVPRLNVYHDILFRNINFSASSNDRQWVYGTHYSDIPKIDALQIITRSILQ